MENLVKQLATTIKTLQYTDKRTVQVIATGREREISRQIRTMESLSEKFHDTKSSVLHAKIEAEEDNIDEWESLQDEIIEPYERAIDDLQSKLKEMRNLSEMEDEQRKETVKAEIRGKLGDASGERDTAKVAKLPKLAITKFTGTHLDWLRFWGQFEAEIDRANLATVTKFSYLKELVVPAVRVMIDGLPFNSEGYERAKNILQTKYGQSSEIVAEHVKCIMDLPVVSGSNSGKVRDFYQKLVTHVQALETMGKLRDINGNVRITLDKLSHIRSDLVRMDDNWKEWTFPQLVEALRQWIERNPTNEEKREKQHWKHDKISMRNRSRLNKENAPTVTVTSINRTNAPQSQASQRGRKC